MTDKTREKMNAVFIEYGLNREDHVESYGAGETKFTLINRDGIMIIRNKLDIDISYDLVHTNGRDEAVIKATTVYKRKSYETFGEVNAANNTFAHPVNVAEKRAMNRIVLECVGLYEADFLGSDEFHGNPLAEKTPPKKNKRPAIRKLGEKVEDVIKKSKTATSINRDPVTKKFVKRTGAKKVAPKKKSGPPAFKSGKSIAKDLLAIKQVGSTR